MFLTLLAFGRSPISQFLNTVFDICLQVFLVCEHVWWVYIAIATRTWVVIASLQTFPVYFLLVLFSVSPATLEPHAKLCIEQLQHTHTGIITLLGTGNKLTSTVWVGDLWLLLLVWSSYFSFYFLLSVKLVITVALCMVHSDTDISFYENKKQLIQTLELNLDHLPFSKMWC